MKVSWYKNVCISFGTNKESIIPNNFFTTESACTLAHTQPLTAFSTALSADALCFAHQVHGADGLYIADGHLLPKPWRHDADYLITSRHDIGLGIATADCVPVFVYDGKNEVIAAIHAGWKGIAQDIIATAVNDMRTRYNSDVHDMHAWIGPAARACCYEVTQVVANACKAPLDAQRPSCNPDKVYLDLIKTTAYHLEKVGILQKTINTEFAPCTICSTNYHSHRRENHELKRQLSMIVLHKSPSIR